VSRERNVLDASLSVQASDEFRITRAAIDVRELYTVSQEGTGTEKKSVSPLAGSRYVVSRSDDGKLSALDSAGAQVAAAQLKLLKDEFGNVFERSTVGEFLPERPVKLGEKLVPPSDAVIKMLGLKDDGKTLFDGIEFILGKVDGGVASFDVTMTMTQRLDAGLRLRAKLKGQIDLKTDGTWLTRVDLKGPIEVLDGSGATKATGELSANLKETFQ
jgi:hypothetical protein